ncbi:MAG TPA: hypothetical protein VJ872_00545 [Nocardioides sp.]|nr:hypothetical protein [Nocardioides sp.]
MLKKLLVLGALGAIAVGVAKKLQAGAATDGGGWQSSYDPAPAPAAPSSSTAPQDTAAKAAAEAPDDVPPPPVDIPPAKTEVDPLTDPLPEEDA